MRFSREDVREILSQTHLQNTAWAYGKQPTDVTAEELIEHWLKFHIQMSVERFTVEPEIPVRAMGTHLEPFPLETDPFGSNQKWLD